MRDWHEYQPMKFKNIILVFMLLSNQIMKGVYGVVHAQIWVHIKMWCNL